MAYESNFTGDEVVALLEQVRHDISLDCSDDFNNDFTIGFKYDDTRD
jgi:hypothetical protein